MRNPFNSIVATLAAGLFAFAAPQAANAITLNFSSVTNAGITFNPVGDTFSFTDGDGGFDFAIGGGATGAANGLKGNLGGTFTIDGPIITSPGPFLGTIIEQSSVSSSSGTFSIVDASNQVFFANVSWIDIYTMGNPLSTQGGINAGGVLNLSGITYSGTNVDLLNLSLAPNGLGAITFQFQPGQFLSNLTAGTTPQATTYSGTVSSVPEGGSAMALLGLALIGIEIVRRKFTLA